MILTKEMLESAVYQLLHGMNPDFCLEVSPNSQEWLCLSNKQKQEVIRYRNAYAANNPGYQLKYIKEFNNWSILNWLGKV